MARRYVAWGALVPVILLTLIAGLSLKPRSPAAAGSAPGDMGVVVTDLSADELHAAGARCGVLVIDVAPGGPADREDIEEGDIIVEYEHEPVRSAAWLYGRIRRDGEGFLAGVTIRRDGSERWVGFVKLAARPAPPPTTDELEARFARLEDQVDALTARVEQLEQAREIPRRRVLPADSTAQD